MNYSLTTAKTCCNVADEYVGAYSTWADYYACLPPPIRATLDRAFAPIHYRSIVMEEVVNQAKRFALCDSELVLILGEPGTGKELFARAIHDASRPGKPFIVVNCAAIPKDLMESELFGHAPHAFTGASPRGRRGYFEMAEDGTLFLDEIGESHHVLQTKLLRVLQTGEYWPVGGEKPKKSRCRLIAATNRILDQEVAQGNFRLDLLHRLTVLVVGLPSLRERDGDVGFFLDLFLANVNGQNPYLPGFPKCFSPKARRVFLNHHWPGNVRELEHAVKRACYQTLGSPIEEREARSALNIFSCTAPKAILNRPLGNGFRLDEVLAEVERHYLECALRQTGGNKTQAAQLLGLGEVHHNVTNRIHKYPELLIKYSSTTTQVRI